MRYAHILAEVAGIPWALQFEKLEAIGAFLALKADGGMVDPAQVRAMTEAAAARANPRAPGVVGVLPMVGSILPRANLMSDFSGGVTLDRWMGAFRALAADPNVKAIVLDTDSPGGSSAGLDEAAAEIMAARSAKPVVAVANAMMASAAYWIGSAATEIVASPSALVGSIGIYMLHVDQSVANEQAGLKPTFISAGPDKVLGNEHAPLTPEGESYLQSIVNDTYNRFVASVARGRGTTAANVRDNYGQGRVLSAKDALKAGMVDRIATLEETIARFAGGSGSTGARASLERERVALARA